MNYAWQPGLKSTLRHYWLRLSGNSQQCRCPRCFETWRLTVLALVEAQLRELALIAALAGVVMTDTKTEVTH